MIELPIWVFITGLAGFLSIFGAAVWRLRGFSADVAELASALRAEQARLQSEHDAHEDICALRYAQIERSSKESERRLDERHEALVEATDERHRENRANFQEIANKLDRLLTKD